VRPDGKDDFMDHYLEVTKDIVVTLIQNGTLELKPPGTTGSTPADSKNEFAVKEINKAISSIYKTVTNPNA
jgi:hypothetical protein